MTKLFLIIAAAALLACTVFGWQNRASFVADRNARLANNKAMDLMVDEFKNEKKTELDEAYAALLAAQNALAQHTADLGEAKSKIATLDAELGTLKGQMAPIDTEIAKAEAVVSELEDKFPGVTLDTLAATIKQTEDELEEKKQELTAKQAELEIVTKKVAANTSTIDRIAKRSAERLAAIRSNATEGTITAVNNDWGFAVANVGSAAGIKGDSSLIVKRGTQRIAQLEVVSVQPGKTVLNISQASLTGIVEPGDRVIFEKTLD